jgi:pyridoxamine 5'-phosphate oxidase
MRAGGKEFPNDLRVERWGAGRRHFGARAVGTRKIGQAGRSRTVTPLEMLSAWLDEAQAAGTKEPSAMALATVGPSGAPSVRYVLCRGVDERGVRFFTNYESAKAHDLDATGRAAAAFHWATFQRQVRIEGWIARASAEESDAYFRSRPRGHQLASAISPQSQPIASLDDLRVRYRELEARLDGAPVPRPPGWGGYWLLADAVELWRGGPDRLHDRVRYERARDESQAVGTELRPQSEQRSTWIEVRLAP